MIRSLWTSATGMQAQALNLDVISNNLANVNTSGFKKSRAEFQDLLYETLRPAGTSSSQDTEVPTGIQLGHGTRPSTVLKIFTQGDMENTQNELDLAIEGDGFEPLITVGPDGILYSAVGLVELEEDEPGMIDHPIFFCPFCGTPLQDPEIVRAQFTSEGELQQ